MRRSFLFSIGQAVAAGTLLAFMLREFIR